ncbi:ectoine/hydroxyectoine ABC transporter ATP-binding protein EhuA [Haliangium sp.]|uniref:ectoine/hydroxyectoine ABC transporter ATP-binding protein EhuA n=1 Tax=Haliangium sp. TaxID=2663208 RepID=UPI003D109F96
MRAVHKRFGELAVLNGLDLDVVRNQTVSLIGPSGSGKSTILRVLMTLERIDDGRIEIDGEDVWGTPTRAHLRAIRRKLGMVFQHFNLFPHLSVLRNVTEAPVHVLGLSKDEARARAVELLAKVGMDEKVDAYPAQLSGGQKQRVAIARALAMEPEIMLFDEITSALDPELVGEVLTVLRQLAQAHSVTILLVTHQMDFAREVADQIVFLDGGRVVEQGPPAQVLDAPQEERTQAFLRRLDER